MKLIFVFILELSKIQLPALTGSAEWPALVKLVSRCPHHHVLRWALSFVLFFAVVPTHRNNTKERCQIISLFQTLWHHTDHRKETLLVERREKVEVELHQKSQMGNLCDGACLSCTPPSFNPQQCHREVRWRKKRRREEGKKTLGSGDTQWLKCLLCLCGQEDLSSMPSTHIKSGAVCNL